ncbi:MAG: HAMP domain-containing histidine kinase [Elusimicrobia bacterium]|nr:HAMP domain-containing histidine kinase [Elusimicrobiota bacterium]
MRLRTRFALYALVLAEGSLLAALVLQGRLEKRHLQAAELEHRGAVLRGLAQVAADSQFEFNEVFLLNYFKGVLSRSPEIKYAVVLDAEGSVRMHTDVVRGIGNPLGAPWAGPRHSRAGAGPEVHAADHGVQDWSALLLAGERRSGEAHIGFDEAVLAAQMERDLAESRRRMGWVALASSLLAVLGACWLAYRMGRPLAELHEGARLLGAGDLRHRIRAARTDEFGDLARAFNAMASELDRLNKFKEQMMASITHDLRAPLTVIRGHAEMLLGEAAGTEEERRESAQVIYDNARRMSGMADDLTDLAKLRLGRLDLKRRQARLRELLENVRSSMQVVADRLKVRLETSALDSLPPVSVDPAQLERVIVNLVQNSLKFTSEGGRVAVEVAAQPHHLRVTVSDTGIGIPAPKLKNLFSPVLPEEGQGKARTTGLGLSICRELVEAHGGRIRASSEWGRGTQVSFTIPLGDTPCSDAC